MKLFRSALAVLALCMGSAAGADYPDKPITVVVPFPAGQTTDILARALTEKMAKELQQPIVVENKGGAGGIIGITAAKRAASDGYTVLIASSGPLAINENLYKDIPYHTLQDFEPVSMILVNPQFLVTRADFPAKSLPELIEVIKKSPGKYNYGSGGVGLTNHLTMEMLKLRTSMDIRHVPYRGAQAALSGLIGGDTDLMFESGPVIIPHVEAGRLKIWAVGAKQGSRRFPDVKSVAAQGVEGFDATTWMALLVPKGTPAPIVQKLNQVTNKILAQPALQQQFANVTAEVSIDTPEGTRDFIRRELAQWKETIDKGGIRAE